VSDLFESFGESLKKSRQEKGLTPQDVAKATRIPSHIIEDLESGDESRLPARVYVKGFIRAYARELGLDEKELLREYNGSLDLKGEPLGLIVSTRQTKTSNHIPVLVMTLIFAVILLAGGYYFFYNGEENGSPMPPQPVASVEPAEKAAPPVEAPPLAQMDEAPVEPESTVPPETSPSDEPVPEVEVSVESPVEGEQPAIVEDGHTLEVLATQETWLRIYIDDEKISQYLLVPGQTMSWRARDRFKLRLGNAGGLKVILDGESLPPLGKSGEVKEVILPRPDQN
jgi:cytoskeleton protein RodZ